MGQKVGTGREFRVVGVGNALVDLLVPVTLAQLQAWGLDIATMRLVTNDEQSALFARLSEQGSASSKPTRASGGSVANSIVALAQLGSRAGFLGSVGNDDFGEFYQQDLQRYGVQVGPKIIGSGATGTSLVMVAPGGERTMRTCLGATLNLGPSHVDEQMIRGADWVFLEGYPCANGPLGVEALQTTARLARKHGTKVAITCSEAWVVTSFGEGFQSVAADADLIFANASEAQALMGVSDDRAAFEGLCKRFRNVVMTRSGEPVYVSWEGQRFETPVYKCNPVDLTGAGDMFAGAFLHGVTNGIPAVDAARAAAFLSMKVISKVGPRLDEGVQQSWSSQMSCKKEQGSPVIAA